MERPFPWMLGSSHMKAGRRCEGISERQELGSWQMIAGDMLQKTWMFSMRKAGTGFAVAVGVQQGSCSLPDPGL